ncbi:helix-turn-helix transcriptional regulator [Granulosicoccus antarcticus]|uniref:HTH deoR-type domain-containing protein n=1 Tax=Granulosicoccus antarcticus IMCC3135 TaxID=1192854 RepID=A0A2Z2NUA2_9GAMM|nr:YafY family protein [Granulosicoccus antarcticus]ASJ70684.1 hypothetical protein IMCC3135_02855 [Granulosicoccus antarcticus IMCC3135]
MRASRLINILTSLQAHGLRTAAQLATENEVSMRTIYRDIDQLTLAGIPLTSERGFEGGYRLLEGYRMTLNGVSAGEAQALFMAGLPGQAAELGLGAIMASAEQKLAVALPEGLRKSAELARNRFHLDALTWFGEPDQPQHLVSIAAAVWNCRRLHMRYQSWKQEKSLQTAPLGLVLKGGAWYLVSCTDAQIRTYRVSRVIEVNETESVFERPHDFDLARYWRDSTERFEAESYPNQARLRLTELGVSLSPHLLPGYGAMRMQVSDNADDDGWFEATMPVGSVEVAASELLRLGAEVEVLEPVELRDYLRDVVARLASLYKQAPGR